MSLVKYKNKKTGTVYVYESESYWDKDKKQPRNRRKLIGRLDENGNIVPTGSRGRPRKKENDNITASRVAELEQKLQKCQDELQEANLEIFHLKALNHDYSKRLSDLKKNLAELEYYFKDIG